MSVWRPAWGVGALHERVASAVSFRALVHVLADQSVAGVPGGALPASVIQGGAEGGEVAVAGYERITRARYARVEHGCDGWGERGGRGGRGEGGGRGGGRGLRIHLHCSDRDLRRGCRL